MNTVLLLGIIGKINIHCEVVTVNRMTSGRTEKFYLLILFLILAVLTQTLKDFILICDSIEHSR